MSEQVTQNEDGSTTVSYKLSEMNLVQLVQVSQALGRQRDKIDGDMRHIRALIDKRLALGERESAIEAAEKAQAEGGDAEAPGAVIEASAGG